MKGSHFLRRADAEQGKAVAKHLFYGSSEGDSLSVPSLRSGIGHALNQPTRNLLVYNSVGRDRLRNKPQTR